MLVVRIELWPYGAEEDKKALQTLVIGNDWTGDLLYGNYVYFIGYPEQIDPHEVIGDPMIRGTVKEYRRSEPNIFNLVELCLSDAGLQSTYQDHP